MRGQQSFRCSGGSRGVLSKTDLASSRLTTYLSGLPTIAAVDVARNGTVYAVTGAGEKTGPRDTRLFKAPKAGQATVVANLLVYELRHNPDGQSQQARDALSNPFAVLRLRDRTLVATAGRMTCWR